MSPLATHSATAQLAKRRRYRRAMIGSVVGGTAIALLLREVAGYPLLGEAVYWLGILAFLAVWWGTDVTLFDERDRALERRASHLTLSVVAAVSVVVASAARLATFTGVYAVPEALWTALWAYIALFGLFGAIYVGLRFRP